MTGVQTCALPIFLLVLIPEQRSTGWIVASMDAITTPLMPGRAELRVDGRPSGSTQIPEYGLGQSRLPFGSASRLSAKKTPLVESTGSSWLGGSGIFIHILNKQSAGNLFYIQGILWNLS